MVAERTLGTSANAPRISRTNRIFIRRRIIVAAIANAAKGVGRARPSQRRYEAISIGTAALRPGRARVERVEEHVLERAEHRPEPAQLRSRGLRGAEDRHRVGRANEQEPVPRSPPGFGAERLQLRDEAHEVAARLDLVRALLAGGQLGDRPLLDDAPLL